MEVIDIQAVKDCLAEVSDCEDKQYAIALLEWAIGKRTFNLAEHDADLLDKVEYRINQRKESNKICLQNSLNKNNKEDAQYFRNLLFEDDLATDIIEELKAEVEK